MSEEKGKNLFLEKLKSLRELQGLTESHPLIAKRIGRLETLQEQESEEEDNDSE